MAHKLANWIRQTSTSGGAETIELDGPPPQGYRAFSAVLEDGDTTDAVVTDVATGIRQAAKYSYADNVLTFVELIDSFTGSPIDFAPGDKIVDIAPLANASSDGDLPNLPTPQIMAAGSIKLSSVLPGDGRDDPLPKLRDFCASGEVEDGKVYVFDNNWGWIFRTRPGDGDLGPQGQYVTLPRRITFENAPGAVLDSTAYDQSGGGSRVYFRRDGGLGTAYAVVDGVEKGARSFQMPSDDAIALANAIRATRPLPLDADGLAIGINQIFGARLTLSALARWLEDEGGWTQADAVATVTGEIVDGTLTVTVGASGSLAVGTQLSGTDVDPDTVITAAAPGGGVGVYTVTPGGQSVASTTLRASKGFNRRTDTLIVDRIEGTTVYLLNSVQDDYDPACMPVVQLCIDEPEITWINPQAIGPGIDRFLQVTGGRTRVIGGNLQRFDQMVRIFGSFGGCVRDLVMYGVKPGAPGGGLTIGDDTMAFLVACCTSYGGGQMFMQSGSGIRAGVTRDVLWRELLAYNPFNGYSTHNIAERMTYVLCKVFDSRNYGFDLRCPNNTVRRGEAWRSARCAILARIIASIGLTIEDFYAFGCLTGFQVDNDFSPMPDFPPGKMAVRRSQFLETGGPGSHGGIAAVFDADPAFPRMAAMDFADNTVSMVDNSPAYRIQAAWGDTTITNNRALAPDGYTPAGRSFIVDAPAKNPVPGGGPANVEFTGNRWAMTYADAVVRRTSGPTTYENNGIIGLTTTGARALTEDTVLRLDTAKGLYTTEGATGPINVDLPPPNAVNSSEEVSFILMANQELNLRSTGMVALKIGTDAPGFNVRADVDGTEITVRPMSTKLWNVRVVGSVTQDWTPFELLDTGPWFGIGSPYLTEIFIGDDGGADDDDGTGDSEVVEVATRWTDVYGNDVVLQTTDTAVAPEIFSAWLDFAGQKYLTDQAPGVAVFPTGADPACFWFIGKQVIAAADTTERSAFAVGGSSVTTRRQISRIVSGGVNRFSVFIGDGSTAKRATVGSVDFSGWCWGALIYDGADLKAVCNGVESSAIAVTGATTDDRVRVGASPSNTIDQFWDGKVAHLKLTGILSAPDRADYEAWLTSEVARLNELDP